MVGTYLTLFFSGFAGAVLITMAILKFVGHSWGADKPDGIRKTHSGTISRLGGLPIFVAFAIGAAGLSINNTAFFDQWWPVILTCSLMFLLGFIDDLRPLGAKIKLFGQVSIALVGYGCGMNVPELGIPFTDSIELTAPFSFAVVILWLVALPNLINLIDGMDGLATGLGMFLTLTLAVVGISAFHQHDKTLALDSGLLSLIVSGALLGFLLFNFPPAKIFLGDGGAYFIGFFIAATSLTSANKGAIVAPLLVVFIALGLPIIDTTFAIFRRAIKGLPLFRADADHIHHRLLQLGFSKSNALFTLYSVAGVLSLIGLSFYWAKGFALPIAGGAIFLLALLGARYLGYVESWRDIRNQVRRALRHRREIQYATILGDLTEMDVDRCQSAEEFWDVFDRALARLHLSRHPHSLKAKGFEVASVSLEVPHAPSFTLYYPSDYPRSKNWRALASSMHPAYVSAVERWGSSKDPIPSQPMDRASPADSAAPVA